MTNTKLLRSKISALGLKYVFIAVQMGLSTHSLYRKIENKVEFKASEIQTLCNVLHIDDAEEKEKIFFI